MSDKKYQTIVVAYKGSATPLTGFGIPVMGKEVVAIAMGHEIEKAFYLKELIDEILCFEESGHNFDSDDTLSQIFNLCRKC